MRNAMSSRKGFTASELERVLTENILGTWYPRTLDFQRGGFLTNFSHEWIALPEQEKHIVTQSRGLWTASNAALRYSDNEHFYSAADHGFAFLRDQLWDSNDGGFHLMVGPNKDPFPSSDKTAYGTAFGIYSLCAYYALTKEVIALSLAKEAFLWLDHECHDPVRGGYFNSYDPSRRRRELVHCASFRCSQSPLAQKDQDSMLHIIEALTDLYSMWRDSLVRERLVECIALMCDVIFSPFGTLQLKFDADWNVKTFKSRSRREIENNFLTEHVSFGHDIEAATLLLKAARAIGSDFVTAALPCAEKLMEHTLSYGFDRDFHGIFYGAYYYPERDVPTVIWPAKAWWVQAEGLLALVLFTSLKPEVEKYRYALTGLWNYICEFLIDWEHGDWFCEGLDLSPHARFERKAHAWKCNYHNARSLLWSLYLLECTIPNHCLDSLFYPNTLNSVAV